MKTKEINGKTKKILLSILCAGMVFGCVACGSKEEDAIKSNEKEVESENVEGVETDEEENENEAPVNYNDYMQMYLYINDIKIKLNETTIDEYLSESGWKDYETPDPLTDVCSSVILNDGKNKITLVYLNENRVIFQAYTNEDFDNGVTKLEYEDNYIGKVAIGDVISTTMLEEQYFIDKENFKFHLEGDEEEMLVVLYENSNPVILNYLYYNEQGNFSGVSLWWYIY